MSGIHFWTPEDLAGSVGRFEELVDLVHGVVAVENRIFWLAWCFLDVEIELSAGSTGMRKAGPSLDPPKWARCRGAGGCDMGTGHLAGNREPEALGSAVAWVLSPDLGVDLDDAGPGLDEAEAA